MREVIYRLSDGVVTKSYEIAKASGLSFTTQVREVITDKKPMSEKRREALRKKFGWA